MTDDVPETAGEHPDLEYEEPERNGSGSGSDPDVLLNVPTLKVEKIALDVEDLRARVSLEADVLQLVTLNVGVDVVLGKVNLEIDGVEAQALLKVRLDNVAGIVSDVLRTIDNNPEIITQSVGRVADSIADVGHQVPEAVDRVGGLVKNGHLPETLQDITDTASSVTDQAAPEDSGQKQEPEPEPDESKSEPEDSDKSQEPGDADGSQESEDSEEPEQADESEADEAEPDEPDESEADEAESDEPDESEADEAESDEPEPESDESDEPESEAESDESGAEQEPEFGEPASGEPAFGEPVRAADESDGSESGPEQDSESDEPESETSESEESGPGQEAESDESESDESESDKSESDESESGESDESEGQGETPDLGAALRDLGKTVGRLGARQLGELSKLLRR